jgi:hypothetical protein
MNIYTLTAAQKALQAKLEESGFDAQTIADTLDGEQNTEALKEKRLGYVAVIMQKRASATARKAAALAINELASADLLAADRLERALFESLLATGDTELVGVEFEARIKGKTAALEIVDEALVPIYYWTAQREEMKIIPAAIDKMKIKEDLKLGRLADGVKLGINKKLEIK